MKVVELTLSMPARYGIAGFFLGSAPLKFLKKLTCSLLAVKPDGFVSPVRFPAD